MKIAFIVGKSSDNYPIKITSKKAPKWLKNCSFEDTTTDNYVPSDVAMASYIECKHPKVEVDIIEGWDVPNLTVRDLDEYKAIFVVYDAIEVFHCGRKKTCSKDRDTFESLMSKTKACVYPPPKFHKYIISKPTYYKDLEKAGLPVVPFFCDNPTSILANIKAFRNKVKQHGFKGVIIKPSYAGYSLGIIVFKNLDRTTDAQIKKKVGKLVDAEFKELTIQQFISSFASHYEIRTYWLKGKYAYSVGTLTEAVGTGDGLPITGYETFKSEGGTLPNSLLTKIKPIAKKALQVMKKYDPYQLMVRVDIGCCMDNIEGPIFINEVETYAANLLAGHTDFPIIEKLAEVSYKFARDCRRR